MTQQSDFTIFDSSFADDFKEYLEFYTDESNLRNDDLINSIQSFISLIKEDKQILEDAYNNFSQNGSADILISAKTKECTEKISEFYNEVGEYLNTHKSFTETVYQKSQLLLSLNISEFTEKNGIQGLEDLKKFTGIITAIKQRTSDIDFYLKQLNETVKETQNIINCWFAARSKEL